VLGRTGEETEQIRLILLRVKDAPLSRFRVEFKDKNQGKDTNSITEFGIFVYYSTGRDEEGCYFLVTTE
jgi:hypothetical protein